MIYQYVTDNNLENIQNYNYTSFEGVELLKAFYQNRHDFIKRFDHDGVCYESYIYTYVDSDLDKLISNSVIEMLIKTFEVNKRLYSKYTFKEKNGAIILSPDKKSDYKNINNYIKFGQILCKRLINQFSYFYLNSYIKLVDILISLESKYMYMDVKYIPIINALVFFETKFVDSLFTNYNHSFHDFINNIREFKLSNEAVRLEVSLENASFIPKSKVELLSEFALVCASSTRSEIYIDLLIKNLIFPSCIIFYDEGLLHKYEDFLIKNDVKTYKLINPVINDKVNHSIIADLKQKYIIYSGAPGEIIGDDLLKCKKFIHVHAGKLPEFRGSTTCYYSLLENSSIYASAMFLNSGIDCGDVLREDCYNIEYILSLHSIDIDYYIEPVLRATTLVRLLKKYINEHCFVQRNQSLHQSSIAHSYYRIHPLLKHLAIIKVFALRGSSL